MDMSAALLFKWEAYLYLSRTILTTEVKVSIAVGRIVEPILQTLLHPVHVPCL